MKSWKSSTSRLPKAKPNCGGGRTQKKKRDTPKKSLPGRDRRTGPAPQGAPDLPAGPLGAGVGRVLGTGGVLSRRSKRDDVEHIEL